MARRKGAPLRCSVCYCYRSLAAFSMRRCSSCSAHQRRSVCDSCVHMHVINILYACITSSVTCPESNCKALLSVNTVRALLNEFGSKKLRQELDKARKWEGKSEEWIKTYAAYCPQCKVGYPVMPNVRNAGFIN